MLSATVHIGGLDYVACLVETFDPHEGAAIVESADGSVVANGTWTINPSRDIDGVATPTTLSLDFPDACELAPALLNALMDALVKAGASWGLDGYAVER
jgi:hypothetical protein